MKRTGNSSSLGDILAAGVASRSHDRAPLDSTGKGSDVIKILSVPLGARADRPKLVSHEASTTRP